MADILSPDMNLSLLQATQADPAKAAARLEKAKQERAVAKATEAAQDFEAVFIAEMIKPMFEGISTEAPFGGGKGEEVFRGMLMQEYGKLIARTGGVGLSGQVRDEMIRMQAQADHAQAQKS